MRSSGFFILFLLGYVLCCSYVIVRATQALPKRRWLRVCAAAFLTLASASFFLGIALQEVVVLGIPIGHVLRNIGVTWVVSLPYWVIGAVFWVALKSANRFLHFFPRWVDAHYARAKFLALVTTVVSVAAIFAIGYYRFSHPVTTVVNIKIDKQLAASPSAVNVPNPLHIVVASDLHLGDIIGAARLRGYVERINALNPDLILLPGDVIDRSVEPLEKQNMGPELAKLRAPLGVYAVLGNHESYAGAARSEAFLKKHGIQVLSDEIVPIAGGAFYLIGRRDSSARLRKTPGEILSGIDHTRPIIAMDHQPRDLDDAAAANIDLQFSGHTHGGQIWPVSWVIPFLFEVPYGYARKGGFQIYVTSGLGLWGFPARIGSVSEVVDVRVEFAK